MDETTQPHEEFEAKFSDLHDGSLPEPARSEVLAHLATCAACKAAYDELCRTLAALDQIKGTPVAPESFGKDVEETIRRRSAGRFFGKKTLGDRVPFGVLLVIALIVLVAVALTLWASTTGSLRV